MRFAEVNVGIEEGCGPLRPAFISPQLASPTTHQLFGALLLESGISLLFWFGTTIALFPSGGHGHVRRSDCGSSGWKLCRGVRPSKGRAGRFVPHDERGSPRAPL